MDRRQIRDKHTTDSGRPTTKIVNGRLVVTETSIVDSLFHTGVILEEKHVYTRGGKDSWEYSHSYLVH